MLEVEQQLYLGSTRESLLRVSSLGCIRLSMQVVRLNPKSMGVNTSSIADNRLRQAADRFDIFKAKLKLLRNAMRTHHVDLVRSEASRSKVVQALKEVSHDSPDCPIFDLVGGESSYVTVHTENNRDMSARLKEYQVELINYIANWEGTVTTRIATELKHVDRLYKNFVRYVNKVESLKVSAEKKKALKDSDLEKISRNESKLRTAKKEYHRMLVNVTLLTEEVTERGWKDMLPLMIRIINFDVDVARATADRLDQLVEIREEMESLAKRFEMDEHMVRFGRIDVLLESDAMEFVRPEHMQDIDSIQASVASFVPLSRRIGSRARAGNKPMSETEDDIFEDSPSGSDNDSVCPTDEKNEKGAQIHPDVECSSKGIELKNAKPVLPVAEGNKPVIEKRPRAPPEEEMEEQGSIIRYPTSIYLKIDGTTMLPMDHDDETTLTPSFPDMASF